MPRAKFASIDLCQLGCKNEPLIWRQPSDENTQVLQFLPVNHLRLEPDTGIDYIDATWLDAVDRKRHLECSLHRASSRQRSAPIVYTRHEALLESVGDMRPARERPAAMGLRDHLDDGLAETVFEILPT